VTHQHTIERVVRVTGVALRTGRSSTVELRPAAEDTGICFVRDAVQVPAQVAHVVDTRLATTLGAGGVTITMVEHLCAALRGAGVDNVAVHVEGDELPVLDGSARPWLDVLEPRRQGALRRFCVVERVVEVRGEGGWARLEPADAFELDLTITFDHPSIGLQRYVGRGDGAAFRDGIAWARTFGFLRDAELLRAAGLAHGASLENTVVYDDTRVLNPGGLRSVDEAVRHKALDAVGDAALLGAPLKGRLVAFRAGHTLHHALFRALLATAAGAALDAR
jgi:UDP-3-O-[3-hydroxymyristoyl] N-acetylglucosamine deacetylase